MSEIKSLTDEQQAKLVIYKEKWLKIGLSTDPIDEYKIRKIIPQVYKAGGLKPPKEILFFDNPISCFNESRFLNKAQVFRQVRDQVRDQVFRQVRDQVGTEVRDQIEGLIYSSHATQWLSFYDFIKEELGLHNEIEPLSPLIELAKHSGWYLPYKDVCLVSRKSKVIHFDKSKRLHYSDAPAISYHGYEFYIYAWHGLIVPEHFIMERDKITPEMIVDEENAEKRRALIEIMSDVRGSGAFVKAFNPKVIDKDTCLGLPRNLYQAKIKGDKMTFVSVENGTVENGERRSFLLGAHPDDKTCHDVISRSYGVDSSIYEEIART